ncbi:MAG TPA: zf-HC2 domain-containing protein [Thermoanaerobaculaceae bacterium]|nr:zf-HC2 domain-containing protein [Thermoanaerobaculaceae bacterium]
MTPCDLVREHLDATIAGEIEPTLAAHIRACSDCQEALRLARQTEEGGAVLHSIRAPAHLKERLKALVRLPLACEQALASLDLALDGELEPRDRDELLAHFRACHACQTAWEAFATLREVGSLTKAPALLRAQTAVHPENRLRTRRTRRTFDLRLATAAAYLLAAMTVFLIGNPAHIARASNAPIEKAAVYTRAAVENRFESYTRRLREGAVAAQGWVGDTATNAWNGLTNLITRRPTNPKPSGNVVPDGNGGRP